jgi:hypothetical protein
MSYLIDVGALWSSATSGEPHSGIDSDSLVLILDCYETRIAVCML